MTEPSAWEALAKSVTNDPEKEIAELRQTVMRQQQQIAKKDRRDAMVSAAITDAVKDVMLARGVPRQVPAPKRDMRRKARPEVALMHFTDWQGSKITPTYNSDVMRQRVERAWQKVDELTEIGRAHHPVRDAVILFGGDMIEGLFNYPAQLNEVDKTLFGQWADCSQLVGDTVRWALGSFERVTVFAEWGNHGRIGSKRAEVPKGDNFDRMVYEHARKSAGLVGHPRLVWEDCPEDIQRVEIGEYRALLMHGDEVGRNGFASPTAIVQHANRWRSGAYPWPFRDVYLGHYHTHAEWPMANGEGAVFQTGSTESDNRYARDLLASSARPSQRLHFIDPQKGRVTSQHKLWLDD